MFNLFLVYLVVTWILGFNCFSVPASERPRALPILMVLPFWPIALIALLTREILGVDK